MWTPETREGDPLQSEAIHSAQVSGILAALVIVAAFMLVPAPTASAAGPSAPCPPYPCLATAAEVMAWSPDNVSPFERASVPLADRVDQPDPGMLVGVDNSAWSYWSEFDLSSQGSSARGDVYNFSHWQYIDTFYYYRHSLLAVPPAVWTDAAHRNGVATLGTLTGDCGGCAAEFRALFDNPGVVDQLALMASTYGFDGWFVDVEDPDDGQGDVTATEIAAMRELRTRTLPNGQPVQVAYYQAGVLALYPPQQDGVDPFHAFLAAGQLQTDYARGGHTSYPLTTYHTLDAAGMPNRRFDTHWSSYVYYYETSCSATSPTRLFNGKTCLDIANLFANLRSAEGGGPDEPEFLQSLSFFAPEWTLFGGSKVTTDPLPTRVEFSAAEDGLWVGTHGVGSGGYEMQEGECRLRNPDANTVATMVQPRSPITRLPFVSRFNTGEGDRFWVNGHVRHDGVWNLLSAQDVLPTAICPDGDTLHAEVTYDGSFDGGSQLSIDGQAQEGSRLIWLYEAGARMPQPTEFSLTFKVEGASLAPRVAIRVAGRGTLQLPAARERIVGGGWVTTWAPVPKRLQGQRLSRIGVVFGLSNDPNGSVDVAVGKLAAIDRGNNERPVTITPNERGGVLTWADPTPGRTSFYNVWALKDGCRSFAGRTLISSYDEAEALFAPVAPTGWMVQPVSTSGRAARVTTPAC